MAIELPPLPYSEDALAPFISKKTLEFHYGKHHKSYVDTLNKLIAGTPYARASIEEIIRDAAGDESKMQIFNNAGQTWNHTFYWNSMTPGGGGKPTGDLAKAIERNFDGYEGFAEQFADAGKTQFGSGWAWLVAKGSQLEILKTPNAESPLTQKGVTPLLTMDVWEHAYYLDYQNKRPDYITAYLENLVNWDFANANLAKA